MTRLTVITPSPVPNDAVLTHTPFSDVKFIVSLVTREIFGPPTISILP